MKKLTITLFFFIVSAVAAMAQNWAVAVNTADMLDLGTISLEGSVAVSQHWSINAGAKVNPWTFNRHNTWDGLFSEPDPDQKQSRKQTYAIGARWWPWNVYSGRSITAAVSSPRPQKKATPSGQPSPEDTP